MCRRAPPIGRRTAPVHTRLARHRRAGSKGAPHHDTVQRGGARGGVTTSDRAHRDRVARGRARGDRPGHTTDGSGRPAPGRGVRGRDPRRVAGRAASRVGGGTSGPSPLRHGFARMGPGPFGLGAATDRVRSQSLTTRGRRRTRDRAGRHGPRVSVRIQQPCSCLDVFRVIRAVTRPCNRLGD